MKKIILLALILTCTTTFAQEKVKETVSNSYDRNSISVVVVDRGDSADQIVYDAVRNIKYGDKFDKNYIATDRVRILKSRAEANLVTDINRTITSKSLGHQVVKYWYDSDNNGLMDGELIQSRGRFNVNDEDVMSAKSSKIGENALMDTGYALINSSYIMAIDCYNFTDGKDMFGDPNKSVSMRVCLYKVDFPEELQNSFYESCWIDEETSKSEIPAKKSAFSKMTFRVVPVTSTTATGSATVKDGGVSAAIANAYGSAIKNLEGLVSSWEVITAVKEVRPIRAKIGTKEGLKNTDRYAAYEYKERKSHGETIRYSKKMGYLRATKVASNTANATGESPSSEFYQISRIKNIQAGQLLKQSNDLGMGVMAGYSIGGMSQYNLDMDYLARMNTKGVSHYGLLDFGYDIMTGSDFNDPIIRQVCGDMFDAGISFINVGLGYGLGVRLTRFVELMPLIMVGGDYLLMNGEMVDLDESDEESDEESEEEILDKIAFFGKAGLKVNITVAYPLQIVAGASYSLIVSEGDFYKAANDLFEVCEGYNLGNVKKRTGGLGFTLGIKYTF